MKLFFVVTGLTIISSNTFSQNQDYNRFTTKADAACSWALANEPDSAFYQIDILVKKINYKNIKDISTDADLISLHSDKRWSEYIGLIKGNKEKAEANLDLAMVSRLDSIYEDDQKLRKQSKEIESKFGWDSKELKDHWKIINFKDSINLVKVKDILDSRGWCRSRTATYSNLFIKLGFEMGCGAV